MTARSEILPGRPTPLPSVPGRPDDRLWGRWLARVASVAACVLMGKAYALAAMREFLLEERGLAAVIEGFLLFGQDVLLIVILASVLALGVNAQRPRRESLSWLLVSVVVVINGVLNIVVGIMLAFVTPEDPLPYSGKQLALVTLHYGTNVRYFVLLATFGLLIFFPRYCQGTCVLVSRFLRVRRWTMAMVVAAVGLYVAIGFRLGMADEIVAFPRHKNVTLNYVMAAVSPPARFDRSAAPATPEEIADLLAGPVADAGGLEPPSEGIPKLLDRPANVVLVIMESVGAATIYDDDGELYPFLGRIRDRAVAFRRYQATTPISADALLAIFCGLGRLPEWPPVADVGRVCRPLPGLLGRFGVRTGFFHSSYFGDWLGPDFYDPFGFETIVDSTEIIRRRQAAGRPVEVVDGRVKEHETVDETLKWIEERCERHEPFFATYYPWVAHAPYPAAHAEGFALDPGDPSRHRYRQLVRVLDAQTARIHAALEDLECGRPFVLVVVGDHGEAFYEHPGNVYHSSYVYEENLRSPLLLISDALEGRVSDRVATHLDLASTLADLAIGDAAVRLLGSDEGETWFDGSLPHHGVSLLRPGSPRPAFGVSKTGILSVRFGSFKYIRTQTAARLFDTDRDPRESHDLRVRHPELTAAMDLALDRWAARIHSIHSGEALDVDTGD